jgi:C4-type Zn-finger protein
MYNRLVFEQDISCPHCEQDITVEVVRDWGVDEDCPLCGKHITIAFKDLDWHNDQEFDAHF